MEKCRVSISTTADGQKSGFLSDGEIVRNDLGFTIRYHDQNANVSLILKDGEVSIKRQGDYSLSLHLIEERETKGSLGIGGTEGEISVYTQEISYLQKGKSSKLSLRYELIICGERQQMQLLLLVKV